MAASDSLIQQMLGHGIAAKLSQRLGEGVLNGLLTARLGLAAIDVTRPLPFTALPRPALADLAKDLLRKREGDDELADFWRRISCVALANEMHDQADRLDRSRAGRVLHNEGVRLAVELPQRDPAAGFGVGGDEPVGHVRGDVVVGGALDQQGGGRFFASPRSRMVCGLASAIAASVRK